MEIIDPVCILYSFTGRVCALGNFHGGVPAGRMAERLEDLINEFFEIIRFNLFNIMLECSKVNLTRLLEQLTCEFRPMLSEKN